VHAVPRGTVLGEETITACQCTVRPLVRPPLPLRALATLLVPATPGRRPGHGCPPVETRTTTGPPTRDRRSRAGPRRSRSRRAGPAGRPRPPSAPAGYGKTTVVHQWLEGEESPAAWLRLEDLHNDPVALLSYLAETLATVAPLEPITEVFRVASGEARFWTLGDILKERRIEPVSF